MGKKKTVVLKVEQSTQEQTDRAVVKKKKQLPAERPVKKESEKVSNGYEHVTGAKGSELAKDILSRTILLVKQVHTESNIAKIIYQAMDELKPQNTLEGMLCSQILSLHCMGMSYLNRSEIQDMRCHQDPDLNNAVKLLRLQHETIELLQKLRRNGEQRVVVQHVNVENGGKAIVGGVFEGGGVQQKTSEVPYGHSANM